MTWVLFIELLVAFGAGVGVTALWGYSMLGDYEDLAVELEERIEDLEYEIRTKDGLIKAYEAGNAKR